MIFILLLQVVFEGLWSRQTHPKNFPNNSWEAKFSDVIGASHSADYQFWNYGKPAGEGLHEVAADGTTKMLESEFKQVVCIPLNPTLPSPHYDFF